MRLAPGQRIFLAGHGGLVGQALARALRARGHDPAMILTRARDELDLTRQHDVDAFFARERPEVVLLAAARVGGILANDTHPAEFITQNLLIQTHVLDAARRHGVELLLFLGSSCIYPRMCPQPMREEHLLTGPLEPTNAPYAVAKIAGVTTCQSFQRQYGLRYLPVMPTNLYGPGDDFDLKTSHVLPALIRRFHEASLARAPRVTCWGTGTPRREFLHVDDLADACLFLLSETDEHRLTNIGVGEDLSIAALAALVARVVGYQGDIAFDPERPDGTPRKLLDVSRLRSHGWRPDVTLEEGVRSTYSWFIDHHTSRPESA